MNNFRQLVFGLTLAMASMASAQTSLSEAKRILFLGDSITYDGKYVAHLESVWRLQNPQREFTVICCGLPSETVSGLSEVGHADNKFPRPDLHERLQRVLHRIKPDFVIACYGMNDGIYLPLADERFNAFKRGMQRLHDEVAALPAGILHLTPAAFDPVPIQHRVAPEDRVDAGHPYEKYDDVLDHYAQWMVGQKSWRVIDVHSAMRDATLAARKSQPNFTLAPDGVHPNAEGHFVIATTVLKGLGATTDELRAFSNQFNDPKSKQSQLFSLVYQRQRILTDAWLTHTLHQRPMKPGLPLEQAEPKAAEVDAKIRELLASDTAAKAE